MDILALTVEFQNQILVIGYQSSLGIRREIKRIYEGFVR